jgi:hypothetical protein
MTISYEDVISFPTQKESPKQKSKVKVMAKIVKENDLYPPGDGTSPCLLLKRATHVPVDPT